MSEAASLLEQAVVALAGLDAAGRFHPDDLAGLERLLSSSSGDALTAMLFEAGLFVMLFEGDAAMAPAIAQITAVAEAHAPRLPAPIVAPGVDDARRAAAQLGVSSSLKPVGAEPPPVGSVRGATALRLQKPPRG